jgi:RNA polymerase sigma-70 factor (ECF subfamily)
MPMTASHIRLVPSDAAQASGPGHLAIGQLVDRVRTGDVSAAGLFYDRLRPVVEATLRRLIGPEDNDFEDMAQVALIEIIRSLGRYRGDCSPETWASAVTANVVFKQLRRRKLERTIFERQAPVDNVADPAGDVAQVRGVIRKVMRHLHEMPEARATAFLLHDVFGYDLTEVAAIVGASVSATQSKLVRGRRDLHQRIAADPDLAGSLAPWKEPT